jgi:hypothetical protein
MHLWALRKSKECLRSGRFPGGHEQSRCVSAAKVGTPAACDPRWAAFGQIEFASHVDGESDAAVAGSALVWRGHRTTA